MAGSLRVTQMSRTGCPSRVRPRSYFVLGPSDVARTSIAARSPRRGCCSVARRRAPPASARRTPASSVAQCTNPPGTSRSTTGARRTPAAPSGACDAAPSATDRESRSEHRLSDCRRESVLDERHRVAMHDSHVRRARRSTLSQQRRDASGVHVDARSGRCRGAALACASVLSPMPQPMSSTTARTAERPRRQVESVSPPASDHQLAPTVASARR